jgi:hypothetical protein
MRQRHAWLGIAALTTGAIAGGCSRDLDQILSPELTLARSRPR